MRPRKFIDGPGKSFCPNLFFCVLLIVIESIKTTELEKEVEERKLRTAEKSGFPLMAEHAGTKAQRTAAQGRNIPSRSDASQEEMNEPYKTLLQLLYYIKKTAF